MRTRSAALAVVAAAVTVVPALTALAAPATAANTGQVCVGLDSGKIDTQGDPRSVTVTAPAGRVITGYCVKAGSVQQGNGPVNVTLATPVATLVITHPSGKAVSHYSVAYGAAAPTVPTEPTGPTEPEIPETPTEPEVPAAPETPVEPETEVPSDPAPAIEPWDWNWQYAAPTCDALTVRYPANLPEGQANDVNIRIRTDRGEVTLNYHLDRGTWSGTTGFTYSQHRSWPAGVASYTVTWVQVAGTNHHWQGALACGPGATTEPVAAPVAQPVAAAPAPVTRTTITGFAAGTVRVAQGRAVGTDAVTLAGLESVVLQRRAQGTWRTLRTVASSAGTVRVTFPRERRTGTYAYRLVVPSTDAVTGATSPTLKVKVVAKKAKR